MTLFGSLLLLSGYNWANIIGSFTAILSFGVWYNGDTYNAAKIDRKNAVNATKHWKP